MIYAYQIFTDLETIWSAWVMAPTQILIINGLSNPFHPSLIQYSYRKIDSYIKKKWKQEVQPI